MAHIIELLETGKEEAATAELQQLLALDPGNKAGQSLQRQITGDPVAMLGEESFPYTIKPGDSMSVLAKRFLGDSLSFYVLCRYNGIKVARQLVVGQTIKIPGRPPANGEASTGSASGAGAPAGTGIPGAAAAAPAVSSGAAAPPGPIASPLPPASPQPAVESSFERAYRTGVQAESAGENEKALAAFRQASQLDPNNVDAKAKAEEVRQKLVSGYTYAARSAFAKQDLDGAIRSWDQVLVVDPGNETARLERQKTITLRDKLRSIPSAAH